MRFVAWHETIRPYLRLFDWVLAFGSLGWGIYTQSWLWVIGGTLGLALAWLDPGTRLKNRMAFIKPAGKAAVRPAARRGR